MIQVDLDESALAAEVEAVKCAFDEAGLVAQVNAGIEYRSVTFPPWVIYVTVSFASVFFAGFAGAAGADAWKSLRDLIGKLYEARENARSHKGAVVLRVTTVSEEIAFEDGLPDVAFRQIVEVEIAQTESTQLRWDPKTSSWRDALEIDDSGLGG